MPLRDPLVNAAASVVPAVLPGVPPVGVKDPVPVTTTPAGSGSEWSNARVIGSADTVPPALLTLALIEERPDATGPVGSNAVISTAITPRISSPLGFVTDTTGGVVSVTLAPRILRKKCGPLPTPIPKPGAWAASLMS